jgi:thiol-disulfide isomerase/thioredoxin
MNYVRVVVAAAAVLSVYCAGPAVAQETKPRQTVADPANKRLTVGDEAPAVKVAKWVKGDPIKSLEKGTVYVIEFGASWCQPWRKSIPKVTELAQKYKDKGVKFFAVAIWEDTKEKDGQTYHNPLPEIEKFVADMGDQLGYNVAYGGDEPEMAETWMKAANRSGIPTAFIVDKEGRIAWIGSPADGLDTTLELVMTGKFDPKAAQDSARKKAESLAKAKELGQKLRNAVQGGRAKEALDVAREMFKLDPKLFPNAAGVAFQQVMVNMGQQDLAYEFAKEMFAGPIKDSEQDLNTMAWTILDDASIKKRDIDLALAMAQRAVEVTKNQDGAMMDTLARAYWDKGDAAKALEVETVAVALAEKDERLTEQLRQQLRNTLEKYKKGKR